MTKHRKPIDRTVIKSAALALAIAAGMSSAAYADTVISAGKHHFVFYRDHNIYYAPESHTYFWLDNGRWQSGTMLPEEQRTYVTTNGVDIDLDTDRPYERHAYVVAHYGERPASSTTVERTTSDDAGAVTTTTTTTTTKHRYVYYGDHDIFFSPETKTYFWQSEGRWHSGDALPVSMMPYIRSGGQAIELDTVRPYERHDYVVTHYRHHDD
jgi:hypothetical protein